MPLTDTVSDFLTRIRNAGMARHKYAEAPKSKLKVEIARILKEQGFIEDYEVLDEGPQGKIKIKMRYYKREAAIRSIRRVSSPGRRVYASAANLPRVKNGLGIAIISTSKGVMTDKEAREANAGGETLCEVW